MALGAYSLYEAGLAELFPFSILRFRNAVGVQHHGIARGEPHFCNRSLPVIKKSHNGAGGLQTLHGRL